MAQTQQWFARINGKAVGPLDMERLQSFVESRHVTPETELSNGNGRWVRAGDVPELFPPQQSAPVTPPTKRRATITTKQAGSVAVSVLNVIVGVFLFAVAMVVTLLASAQWGPFGFMASMSAVGVFTLLGIGSQLSRIARDVQTMRDVALRE